MAAMQSLVSCHWNGCPNIEAVPDEWCLHAQAVMGSSDRSCQGSHQIAGLMVIGEFVTGRQRWRIAGYMHAVLNESWALWADSICLLGQNCMEQQESTPRPMH